MNNRLSFILEGIFYSKQINESKISQNVSTENYLKSIFDKISGSSIKFEAFFYSEDINNKYSWCYYWDSKIKKVIKGNYYAILANSYYPIFLELHTKSLTKANFMSELFNNDSFGLLLHNLCYQYLPLNSDEKTRNLIEFFIDELGINFHPDDNFSNYFINNQLITKYGNYNISDFILAYFDNLIEIALQISGDKLYKFVYEILIKNLGIDIENLENLSNTEINRINI
jgi:hypothetical protein